MRKRLFHVVLCFILLGMPARVKGFAESEITLINARMGISRSPRFKTDCWAQLAVTIRNKGAVADA